MQCGVPASGTFNGNPFVVAAARKAIEIYQRKETYVHLNEISAMFSAGLRELGKRYRIPLISESYGGLVTLTFTEKESIHDFREWLSFADKQRYNRFQAECKKYGIRLTNKKGRLCISTAHTKKDIEDTLAVMNEIFASL